MSSRMTAGARLERLTALIPWVAGRGEATLDEIAERFDYPRARLEEDLIQTVSMVGVYPYTPDTLIEVDVYDDVVTIRMAEPFRSAMRLTPAQSLALISAGAGLIEAQGEPDGPLARGIAKLARQMDIEVGDTLEIEFGAVDPDLFADVRTAVDEQQAVRIDYYSHGRNDRAERVIEPHRLFLRAGRWNVQAWCRLREGFRDFRLDRIVTLTVIDDHFEPRDAPEVDFAPSPDDPRVTIEVGAAGAWVASYFPIESTRTLDNGRVEIVLAVTERQFLERLLLQLGPEARVVRIDGNLSPDLVSEAAARVLARYGS